MAEQEQAKSLVLRGADAVGQAGAAATGSLVGFLLGGPAGAAGGATLGSLLGSSVKAITDLASRTMSQREELRLTTRRPMRTIRPFATIPNEMSTRYRSSLSTPFLQARLWFLRP